MKYIFISFFIFINFFVFANTIDFYEKFLNEKEPKALFDECIDIINGNLSIQDEIVAEGKEPIEIKKSYFSMSNFDLLKREEKDRLEFVMAGFSYRDLTRVQFYGDRVDVIEPEGEVLTFGANLKNHKNNQISVLNYRSSLYLPKFFHKSDLKKVDPAKIRVEVRGIYDLVIFYPNGVEKHFRRDNIHMNEYNLKVTKLLNKNLLYYSYDKFNNLEEIKSTNPNSSKVYAWIRFNYYHPELNYSKKHKDKYDLNISTSDGKNFQLRFRDYSPLINNKERAKRPFYILEDIHSNVSNDHFDYHLENKKTHPLLQRVKLKNGREKLVEYYLLGNKNPEVGVEFFDPLDFKFERVKTIKEMTSEGFSDEYRLYYENGILNQRGGNTTVLDSKGNKYIYFYNKDFKIEKIQRFKNENGQYFLINEELFTWEKRSNFSILRSKSFLDKNQKVLVQISYFYDENFNIIEEKITGDISGKKEEDSFSKRYRYSNDNKNLIVEKSKGLNAIYQYFYIPDTDLISASYLMSDGEIKKRNFYEYNLDLILIKKVEDDGSSFDRNDLIGISFREINYINPIEAGLFLGYKNIKEKRFLDLASNEEKLFSKKVYSYSPRGKVIKKDIFDRENNYRFSFFYEYDERGNLISKTDLLNKKRVYSYDINNNKTSKIYPNSLTKLYNYDSANNLIQKQIKKDSLTVEKITRFDERNNKIYFFDYWGRETFYEYDSFSNLTKRSTKEKKKKTNISLSYDSFGNISKITKDDDLIDIKYNIFSKPTYINKNGFIKRYIYNLDGTLKTYVDERGIKNNFEYDYKKRVTNKKVLSNRDQILNEKSYFYNFFSLTQIKENDLVENFFYDSFKKLIKEEKTFRNDNFNIHYFYDSFFRRCKTIYNEEIIKIQSLDLLSRVLQEKINIKNKPFYEKNFVYDEGDSFSLFFYINSKMQNKKDILDGYFLGSNEDNLDIVTNNDQNLNFTSLEQNFYNLIEKNLSKISSVNFISEVFKNILIPYDEKASFLDKDFIKDPNIFSINLFLYDDLNLETAFSDSVYYDFNKRKIKVVFVKEALVGMQKNDILVKQILEVLKKPENIEKIDENDFLLSNKKIEAIVNINEKDQFIIQSINKN